MKTRKILTAVVVAVIYIIILAVSHNTAYKAGYNEGARDVYNGKATFEVDTTFFKVTENKLDCDRKNDEFKYIGWYNLNRRE